MQASLSVSALVSMARADARSSSSCLVRALRWWLGAGSVREWLGAVGNTLALSQPALN